MNRQISSTTPITSRIASASKAHAAARERITRYITVLTIFASLPRSEADGVYSMADCIEWEPFPFKEEFSELKEAGCVTGELGRVVTDPHFPKDTWTLSMPGITVSGISKLAELSEYLWKTSVTGKIVNSLIQLSWLIVGVIIGCVGSVLFASSSP